MSYWKTMPVVVHDKIYPNTYEIIVSNKFLLDKINKELENAHVNFNYEIYEGNKLNSDFYKKIKLFFDKEYSSDKDTYMIYHKDIYKFFIEDGLVFMLSHPTSNEVIGYIVGKKSRISINSKLLDILEVSFFCIAQKFRNQHYTPYFINIMAREYILRYNLEIGTYAISPNIYTPYYACKKMIHKPLNIPKLKQCQFLPNDFPQELYFENDDSLDLVYLHNTNLPNHLINTITTKLKQYQSNNYTIYNDLSVQDIKRMFQNKAFHNFLFFNKDKTICDFISLYEIEIKVEDKKMSYISSSIYAMFFKNNTIEHIRIILEMVGQYCKMKNILDMLSFFDIFDVKDYEKELKCFYGEGKIKYHIFNYNMLKIPNHKNAYVTI